MSFALGQKLQFDATFTNAAGAVADPSAVTFRIRPAEGTVDDEVALVYGVATEVSKISTGVYRCLYTPPDDGGYWYCWVGEGSVEAASKDKFLAVERTRLGR